MPSKTAIGDVARWYNSLRNTLPGIALDPRIRGGRALEYLSAMAERGPRLRESAAFILEQEIPLYVTKEAKGVGAGWHETFARKRWISVDRSLGFADCLISFGHEACHLRQTIRVRCSVEGEYEAWRYGFKLRAELAASGGVAPMSDDERILAAMPDTPSRADLQAAQMLMKKIAGPGYLIDRAPLQGTDWQTALIAPVVRLINGISVRGELL
ncbi:MAG: hypothetical protein JW929_10345 [Anaerolineales bacterium]|nr:hypothetical protein [Anaerolineales bacterium]